MSPAQFRRRTSVLGLPKSVYEKYDKVVKGCKVCGASVSSPPRARVSGKRASEFGDVIFEDHQEIQFRTAKYVVLLVRDGATNLLWATAQKPYCRKKQFLLFVCGLRKTTAFRKEFLATPRSSRLTLRSSTSTITVPSIRVGQELLCLTVPKPLFVCSRRRGCCLLNLLVKKVCLKRLHFAKP